MALTTSSGNSTFLVTTNIEATLLAWLELFSFTCYYFTIISYSFFSPCLLYLFLSVVINNNNNSMYQVLCKHTLEWWQHNNAAVVAKVTAWRTSRYILTTTTSHLTLNICRVAFMLLKFACFTSCCLWMFCLFTDI